MVTCDNSRVKKIPCDDLWQPLPRAAGRYRTWLRSVGSLTRRIEQRSSGMKVKVQFQGPHRLHRDERFMMPVGARVATLTREVYLLCRRTPVVYAHSVIQPGDRGAARRLLRRMGMRPLGATLFAEPRIRRYAMHYRKIGRSHDLYRKAVMVLKHAPATLWARRSVFVIEKSPILVTEVFMPGVLKL